MIIHVWGPGKLASSLSLQRENPIPGEKSLCSCLLTEPGIPGFCLWKVGVTYAPRSLSKCHSLKPNPPPLDLVTKAVLSSALATPSNSSKILPLRQNLEAWRTENRAIESCLGPPLGAVPGLLKFGFKLLSFPRFCSCWNTERWT